MVIFPTMTTEAPAGYRSTRSHNASVIANLVWRHEDGILRSELSQQTGLSTSTVWAIVAELMADGLLSSTQTARPKSGRPPAVLHFNRNRQHIVGIEMGASHVVAALCDLRCNVLWHRSVEHDSQNDPPGTLSLIQDLVAEGRSQAGAQGDLLGVGVAVPCPIDDMTLDRLSPRILPAWANVRFAHELYRRLGARVFVDNDANCGASAEAMLGAGRDVSDFAFLKVATGCGAGLYLHHELYRGFSGIAGEIGHTTVDPNGRQCRCGLRGCLEAEIGSAALIEKAQHGLGRYPDSMLANKPALNLSDIVQAAQAKDPLAVELITEAGRYLGIGVANLLNLHNPARVIVGGRLAAAGDQILLPLRESVKERTLWTSVERSELLISELGNEHIAAGAASLVLRAALSDLDLFRGPLPAPEDTTPPEAPGTAREVQHATPTGGATPAPLANPPATQPSAVDSAEVSPNDEDVSDRAAES